MKVLLMVLVVAATIFVLLQQCVPGDAGSEASLGRPAPTARGSRDPFALQAFEAEGIASGIVRRDRHYDAQGGLVPKPVAGGTTLSVPLARLWARSSGPDEPALERLPVRGVRIWFAKAPEQLEAARALRAPDGGRDGARTGGEILAALRDGASGLLAEEAYIIGNRRPSLEHAEELLFEGLVELFEAAEPPATQGHRLSSNDEMRISLAGGTPLRARASGEISITGPDAFLVNGTDLDFDLVTGKLTLARGVSVALPVSAPSSSAAARSDRVTLKAQGMLSYTPRSGGDGDREGDQPLLSEEDATAAELARRLRSNPTGRLKVIGPLIIERGEYAVEGLELTLDSERHPTTGALLVRQALLEGEVILGSSLGRITGDRLTYTALPNGEEVVTISGRPAVLIARSGVLSLPGAREDREVILEVEGTLTLRTRRDGSGVLSTSSPVKLDDGRNQLQAARARASFVPPSLDATLSEAEAEAALRNPEFSAIRLDRLDLENGVQAKGLDGDWRAESLSFRGVLAERPERDREELILKRPRELALRLDDTRWIAMQARDQARLLRDPLRIERDEFHLLGDAKLELFEEGERSRTTLFALRAESAEAIFDSGAASGSNPAFGSASGGLSLGLGERVQPALEALVSLKAQGLEELNWPGQLSAQAKTAEYTRESGELVLRGGDESPAELVVAGDLAGGASALEPKPGSGRGGSPRAAPKIAAGILRLSLRENRLIAEEGTRTTLEIPPELLPTAFGSFGTESASLGRFFTIDAQRTFADFSRAPASPPTGSSSPSTSDSSVDRAPALALQLLRFEGAGGVIAEGRPQPGRPREGERSTRIEASSASLHRTSGHLLLEGPRVYVRIPDPASGLSTEILAKRLDWLDGNLSLTGPTRMRGAIPRERLNLSLTSVLPPELANPSEPLGTTPTKPGFLPIYIQAEESAIFRRSEALLAGSVLTLLGGRTSAAFEKPQAAVVTLRSGRATLPFEREGAGARTGPGVTLGAIAFGAGVTFKTESLSGSGEFLTFSDAESSLVLADPTRRQARLDYRRASQSFAYRGRSITVNWNEAGNPRITARR